MLVFVFVSHARDTLTSTRIRTRACTRAHADGVRWLYRLRTDGCPYRWAYVAFESYADYDQLT